MAKTPFMSVLLPTKNRSHLVGYAIQSALDQTFTNFELIIVDNDDDENATRKAAEVFSDERIRYYRTGDLSMPENWQFALSQATGKYITVLEDKMVLYPRALQTIHDCAAANSWPHIITWKTDSLEIRKTKSILLQYHGTGAVTACPSEVILGSFINSDPGNFARLPRMINSALSLEAANSIMEKTPFKKLFVDVSPDICSGFLQLFFLEQIHEIDAALHIWSMDIANFSRYRKRIPAKQRFNYLTKNDISEILVSHVPLKSSCLTRNGVMNDYLRMAEILKISDTVPHMSDENYFLMCFKETIVNLDFGGSVWPELKMLREFARERKLINIGLLLECVKFTLKRLLRKLAPLGIINFYLSTTHSPWQRHVCEGSMIEIARKFGRG